MKFIEGNAFAPQRKQEQVGNAARQKSTLRLTKPINRIINREISSVEFFRRVLDEALDTSHPLLERLKFISIVSSNLDEFFMIRVPGLKERLGNAAVSADGMTPKQVLDEIRTRIQKLCDEQSACVDREILPALASGGIIVSKYKELSADQRGVADQYFSRFVYPLLTPQAVDPSHPFPYISGGGLNIGLMVRPRLHPRVESALGLNDNEIFVRIKIPASVPRFVRVDKESDSFILIEDLIAENIGLFIPEARPESCHTFRLTRDADLDLRESDAEDLLETMEDNLRLRRFGEVVRLEISSELPTEILDLLRESLDIGPEDVYTVNGPLDLTQFSFLCGLNRPELKDKPLRVNRGLDLGRDTSIFDHISKGDVLLHHPYTPYRTVTDFIKAASENPDVLAIKICLYRMGVNSPIPPLLIRASELGKQVTVLIEIKARFDEANNIEWGKKLEKAGVHVIYGLLGLKTHSKTTLIVRREGDELRRYVHIATGNYNPETSAAYTDLGLLTKDDEIGADATELFNFLTVYSQRDDFKTMAVAPMNLRERMLELIERETANAERGLDGRIIAKLNRLGDSKIIEALYKASQAGVKIDLIVRGICTLRPGVVGLSENIRVRSIVGRLLEHSRVYYFANGGNEEVYVGSSDWMPRNLDRRVEVLSPVKVKTIRNYLLNEYLQAYLDDNVKAHELQSDGMYSRADRPHDVEAFDSQLWFQDRRNIVDFHTQNEQ